VPDPLYASLDAISGQLLQDWWREGFRNSNRLSKPQSADRVRLNPAAMHAGAEVRDVEHRMPFLETELLLDNTDVRA
jgi:hypothetical protein